MRSEDFFNGLSYFSADKCSSSGTRSLPQRFLRQSAVHGEHCHAHFGSSFVGRNFCPASACPDGHDQPSRRVGPASSADTSCPDVSGFRARRCSSGDARIRSATIRCDVFQNSAGVSAADFEPAGDGHGPDGPAVLRQAGGPAPDGGLLPQVDLLFRS
jgi:hypothetical protein